MFKSKRDVDRHVSHVLNRIRNIKERNSRGYQFAKLYFDVSDYESGKRHLQDFLSVRETVPQAHKLMGQICEALLDKNKALEAYKRSLELDPDQTDLVLKVCELYCDPSVPVNPDNAKLWIERAEKHFPGHYTVFKLKERVIDRDNDGDNTELENLITTELLKNPGDVKLHIRLLRLYIQTRDVDRAYDHAVQTEKKLSFIKCLDWYECLTDIYQVYRDQHGCSDDALFYSYKLFAVCNLTSLRIQREERDLINVLKSLHRFDQDLNEAQSIHKQSTEWENFLIEMKGQFFYLTGLLILKRGLKGQLTWKDVSSFSAVCFLLCESQPAVDQKSSWFCQLSQDRRKFYDHLYMMGCDRLSQAGHVIHSLLSKQDGSQWARNLRQRLCTAKGQENLYNIIFTEVEMRRKKDTSFLQNTDIFTGTSLDVPSRSQLKQYDSVAFVMHKDCLNHLVWLALRHHSLKDDVQEDYEKMFGQTLFPNLKFGIMDLQGGDPGSLCQLDIQAYLYVCIRWVALQQRETKRNLHPIPDKPELMPVCFSNNLCTPIQKEWWTTVYKLQSKITDEKIAKLYGILTRGLETLRLVTPHTIPLPLIVHVARTLERRVRYESRYGKTSHFEFNDNQHKPGCTATGHDLIFVRSITPKVFQAEEMKSVDLEGIASQRLNATLHRAAFYWKQAEILLDRIDRNSNIRMPKEMLFPAILSVNDPAQIKDLREHIKFAMACVAMREERYEEALKTFENLPQAQAAYYTGVVYRKLFESLDINTNSATDGSINTHQTALLTKSKDAFYKALDRLETENDEDLKEAVKIEIDGVVCKLISAESGGNLVDSILSNQSQTYSTAESDVSEEDEPLKLPKTPLLSTPAKNYSQPILNPSPTRIEVQFKALESTNTAFSARLSTLEETVRSNEKLIQELFKQLRESRDENRSLREQMQILSIQGLSNMNMSMQRPSIGQSFPGTPQQRNLLNVMNNSFGVAPPSYDYPVPSAIPPHLSQYGYAASSPRPGSAYGQPTFEDELNNIDGEYYDPDADAECYIPDQNLIQEWPFGHKTGVEGKSTITYSPQHAGKNLGQANAGMFANALRGQSIQYGYPQPTIPPQTAPQMPGPGFFSQNNQQTVPPPMQTQSGVYPGQSPLSMMMNVAGASPSISPSFAPKAPGTTVTRPATTTMMPPNAVMSSTVEARPKLIPGSVGVPTPKPQTAPSSIPVLPTTSVTSSSTDQSGNTAFGGVQGQTTPGTVGQTASAGVSTPSLFGQKPSSTGTMSTPSILGQTTPGSAASMLSQLAAIQQQPTPPGTSAPTTTPPKTVFKGFTFTSTPKISEPKPEVKPAEEKKTTTANDAPKPFSGFSFTLAKTSAPSATTSSSTPSSSTSQTQSTPQTQTGAGFLFGKNSPQPSFGSLAAQGTTDSVFKTTQDSPFSGSGLSVIGKTPSPRRRDPSAGSDDHVEEYEPTVDFKPVVPLPDLIQVKTGEEDEEKLFADRAKLFRFDSDSKQWKERGIGEIKILKHKEKCQYRVLMRREQVLKLCANHMINADMKLTQMTSSDKAWVWTAADFSEEEMKYEKFAAKFKNVDKAEEFKKVFQECQEDLKKSKETKKDKTDKTKVEDIDKTTTTKVEKTENNGGTSSTNQPQQKSLSQMFKPKAGAWTCEGCYVSNSADTIDCPCCGNQKPGATEEEKKAAAAAKSSSTFGGQSGVKFGSDGSGSSNSGFKFGLQPSSASTASKSEITPSGLRFGLPTSTANKEDGISEALSKPTFGLGDGGFKFGGTLGGLGTKTTESTQPSSGLDIGQPATTKPQTTGFVFGGFQPGTASTGSIPTVVADQPSDTDVGSAGFNVKKDEPKYIFGAPSAISKQEESLAKILTCPDSCNVTQEESLEKEKGSDKQPLASNSSGFSFQKPGSSLFNIGTSKDGVAVSEQDSGFDFGKVAGSTSTSAYGSSASEGFKFSFPPVSGSEKSQPQAQVGSGFNFSMSITKSLTDTTPTKSTVAPISITSPKSPEVTDDGYYVNKEGDDSHIYFEPVVPLPAKVEVKLGEEDEDVIFSHRAKLYRFFKGEWKERGLGNVKILYHVQNNKARIVMRRDAILKLCCNHYITEEISFKPMPNSNNCALVWFAMDFSEGEPTTEHFSIKFKTPEIVAKFEAAVQEVKEKIANSGTGNVAKSDAKTPAVETIGAFAKTTDLKKENVQSKTDPDIEIVKVETATKEQIAKARQFLLPDHFYLYETLPDCAGCRGCDENWTYESEIQQYNEGYDDDGDEEEDYDSEDYEDIDDEEDEIEAKSKGITTKKNQIEKGSDEGLNSVSVFGNAASNTFSFASLAKTSPNQPFGGGIGSGKPFQFEGAGKQLFGAGAGDDSGSDAEGEVTQGDDPHFEPVVPLPELIEVKTGEEDEIELYRQRAKLFRFDKSSNQWKEKGIGDMKILKHKITGKYRLLLRREQVHKLACNHLLTADILFMPMSTSETSWCWTTQDFSESEGRLEQLAIKFKTIDLAKAFKDKIDEIQKQLID